MTSKNKSMCVNCYKLQKCAYTYSIYMLYVLLLGIFLHYLRYLVNMCLKF